MDEQRNIAEPPGRRYRRPILLSILCILSFVGSGLSGTTLFMIYASYKEIIPALQEMSSGVEGMELIVNAPRGFFLAGAVLNFFSFIGVNLMWRMRKAGFHFYTGSQVLLFFLPIVYIAGYPFPLFDGLITLMFIIMYAKYYKKLR